MKDGHGFYVSCGLFTPEHMTRIGPALKEFMWLISHETRQAGRVLNGAPISISMIARDLGESDRETKRNLKRLSDEGYIARERKSLGEVYSYSIMNSKKWTVTGDKNVPGPKKEPGTKMAPGGDKNVPGPGTKMAPGGDKNVPGNKEVDRLDIVDSEIEVLPPVLTKMVVQNVNTNLSGGHNGQFRRFPTPREQRLAANRQSSLNGLRNHLSSRTGLDSRQRGSGGKQ